MQRVSKRWLRHGAVAAIVSIAIAVFGPSFADGPLAIARGRQPSYECDGSNPIYRNPATRSLSGPPTSSRACRSSRRCCSCTPTAPRRSPVSGCSSTGTGTRASTAINTLNADTNHGSVTGGVHATSFPTNFASTMTWDPPLIYQETTAISDEIRGFLDPSLWGKAQNNLGPSPNDYGDLTFWAPTVNMDRDPRWGRTDEAFGEDPVPSRTDGGAFVNGYQGETLSGTPLSKYLKVAATAKHYALNNVEDYRQPGRLGHQRRGPARLLHRPVQRA